MWKQIIKLFILIQLILVSSWLVGDKLLPFRTETFLGRGLGGNVTNYPLLWSRANFDGFYYAKIARDGYQHLQQAFFPLYPKLIWLVEKITDGFVLSGVIISSLSFLAFMFLLSKLLEEIGETKSTIRKTLVYYAVFPTSFYFLTVYSESLFLLWVVLSFYLAQKNKWLLAGLVAGLASYTRVVGLFMVPALIFQYYQTEAKRNMKTRFQAAKSAVKNRFSWSYLKYLLKTRLPHLKKITAILTGLWGFITYGLYLKNSVGDFFYFAKAQPGFHTGRQVNRVVLIYQVLWRYLKMIFTVDITSYTYLIVWFELLFSLLFLFLLIYCWLKTKIPRSWLVFSAFAYLLPTLTGTLTSMPRYVLACFPCFLGLSKLKLPKYVSFISIVLQFVAAMLFVRGFWVA